MAALEGGSGPQIAEAGGRPGRLDPEGNDGAGGGRLGSRPAEFDEGRPVFDHVVRREHGNHGFWGPAKRNLGRDRDRRAGIAAGGLEDDVGLDPCLRNLFGHEKAVIVVGDDDRRSENVAVGQHLERGLKCRALHRAGE